MISAFNPAVIMILGGFILALVKQRLLKQALQLLVPAAAFLSVVCLPEGEHWVYRFLGYNLIFLRVDKLSLCFGYIFALITLLGMVYALHVKETEQHVAALLHAGAALGVTFAGDFFSLFLFWEIMALSSVFLIWCKRGDAALKAGFRYLMVHLAGSAALLAGILMHLSETGSILFNAVQFGSAGSYLILTGFLVNAAVPPFNAWLTDAYPEATVTGSVFLTAFVTKSAVYVLLRGYPGVEILVWLGVIMALYGVVYAVLENDIRRLLAYHIVSQVGYMVCGVGLGTELSLNGSTAHAFCHILYKALLFMGVGGVIHVTGKQKLTQLQGRDLYKKMPMCLTLYMIGAFSISAVPLFNGFVSKTMVVFAAGELHRPVVHLLLHVAAIGTFLHTGLKLPYGTWFGKKFTHEQHAKIEASEPPPNMLIAMGITAFICIFTGIYPKALYALLPYPVDVNPYTAYPILTTIQLLTFTAVAFSIFIGWLGGERTVSLDTDWFYRKGASLFMSGCKSSSVMRSVVQGLISQLVHSVVRWSQNPIQFFAWAVLRKRTKWTPYNPNAHRHAIGIGVMFFLVLFSLFCILLLAS